jgi:hypothetical protein
METDWTMEIWGNCFRFSYGKCIEWLKNLFCCKRFRLLGWEIFLHWDKLKGNVYVNQMKELRHIFILTSLKGKLLNPSFTDWVQNIPRHAIFLNSSLWDRVTIYQYFYLFILVPLTQHNHHSAHVLLFTCGMFFFSNPTGPFCTHVSIKYLKYVFCQTLLYKIV